MLAPEGREHWVTVRDKIPAEPIQVGKNNQVSLHAEESVLSTWPVFLHWRAHLNKQWQWSKPEPFHVHCDPFTGEAPHPIFPRHIPQICSSPPPGTAPRNVLALPLVLRTLWKNAFHLNYYVSNDCSLTNVSLITVFDSLSCRCECLFVSLFLAGLVIIFLKRDYVMFAE